MRRRRRKPADEEEAEEEERKCEVVARVLLEGREVSEEQLQKEVEEQRTKDQEEGRDRTRSRSRSRSKSVLNSSSGNGISRPNSAPPGTDPFTTTDIHLRETSDGFLRPSNLPPRGTRLRAKTMPSHDDFALPPAPFYPPNTYMPQQPPPSEYSYNLPGRLGNMGGGLPAPSPRTAAHMQQLFDAVNGVNQPGSTSGAPFEVSSGFKLGQTDNVSLISPSYSRKFSLGRWEIPQSGNPSNPFINTPASGSSSSDNVPVPDMYGAYTDPADSSTISAPAAHGAHANYVYDAAQPLNAMESYMPAPTYVYLSKADAQNPEVRSRSLSNRAIQWLNKWTRLQIVNHYLSQGYGVSYDA